MIVINVAIAWSLHDVAKRINLEGLINASAGERPAKPYDQLRYYVHEVLLCSIRLHHEIFPQSVFMDHYRSIVFYK